LARRDVRRVLERLQNVNLEELTPTSALPVPEKLGVVELPMMEACSDASGGSSNSSVNGTTMLTKKGDLCFFAGVGFDSLMLDDFKSIKAWSKRTGILRRTLSSVAGYCVALLFKTLPKGMQGKHNIYVELTTNDNSTLFVDHRRGDLVRSVKERVLYKGVTGILAAGTSPFYGGGLRLFPFARMTEDKMHLRLGRIHPFVGFLNIPSIYSGSYRDKTDNFGVIDFMGKDFEVKVTVPSNDNDGTRGGSETKKRGFPFQHSGESIGTRNRFRLRVTNTPVRFICI
jgi:hypothetical protein